MNKHFIRIFKGLLLSSIAVGLFSYGLTKMVNSVRYEHYLVDSAAPVMRWLTQSGSHVGALAWKAQSHPALQAPELQPLENAELSRVERIRLESGQVLVKEREGAFYFYILANQGVWSLRSEQPYRDFAHLKAWIISFLPTNNEDKDSLFDRMGNEFGVHVRFAEKEDVLPRALEALSESETYIYSDVAANTSDVDLFALVPLSDGTIIHVTLPPPFVWFSFPIAILIALLIGGGLGAVLYWHIESLETRLRRLESTATRLARGELEARVEVDQADSIGRLGEAFNTMAEHIQRLVGVQREMIHAVSHELRTPVARIRFGVQMIEDCPNEAAVKKQLLGIDSDIQELDELIDEILTYARLEQGGPILTFQEADVRAIVEQVVSEQGSVKPGMSITATFSEDSNRWKNSDMEVRYIHRAIQNLVGNATRYAASTVKVVCAFEKDTCRVDVEDDGPGIPESDWEKVFTAFARLDDSRTRSSGGYGLGLSIVRRILYWHGGQAFLGRSEMGGAKFSLIWPRKQLG